MNDCLTAAGLTEEPTEAIFQLSAAFVGFEAAVAFNDFVANYERQVTIEMLLDDGNVDATTSFGINEHCALIEKMEAADTFKEPLTTDQIANVATYFVSLGSEPAMKLWSVVGQGHRDNVVALHKAEAADGSKVGHRLVTLLTGGKNE
tara:strand:- start:199 stop:642 length:444 start_codon:yes stop_codon:yes gene_type:complete